eukprot:CAMPEP_0172185508 /NCGR_PEP_ID=MMETSP1050-20130122/20211_1 /TAXON_ID=233186 /ORGANISM="Cryptomonas curvata, Strain CCAP979/52" /LENGTH=104 /DNA_ID=CAMNT_0012859507 /DNA_START=204 /DNA_END=519 /DNA_ORIENTATION=-
MTGRPSAATCIAHRAAPSPSSARSAQSTAVLKRRRRIVRVGVAADAALEPADLPRLTLHGALQLVYLLPLPVAMSDLLQLNLFAGACLDGVSAAAVSVALTSVL